MQRHIGRITKQFLKSIFSAMDLIKNGGQKLLFLVAKSTLETATKITASNC